MLSYAEIARLVHAVKGFKTLRVLSEALDVPILPQFGEKADSYTVMLCKKGSFEPVLFVETYHEAYKEEIVRRSFFVSKEEWDAYCWKQHGVLNLTQHYATPEQKEVGVYESIHKSSYQRFMTFDRIPNKELIEHRANVIAEYAAEEGAKFAMIGGAPYFMSALENALKQRGIQPLYAFSTRESKEETLPDGTVRKVNFFKHLGFIEA